MTDVPVIPLRREPVAYDDLPANLKELWDSRGGGREAYDRTAGTVLGTRRYAREAIESAGIEPGPGVVRLDAEGVNVVTSSYFDEILKAWPNAELVNADDELRITWEMVCEHRGRKP